MLIIHFKRHWLYGEKIDLNGEDGYKNKINKGWFPIKCVRLDEIPNFGRPKHNDDDDKKEEIEKKEN